MRGRGLTAGAGIALLGALVWARPSPHAGRPRPASAAVFRQVGSPFEASGSSWEASAVHLPLAGDASPERGAPVRSAEEGSWIFVYVVRPAGCLATEFLLRIESNATEAHERWLRMGIPTTGFSVEELPSSRDYLITADCYEDVGEGKVRHRFGRATIANLLGSAVVFIDLSHEETFEDRT